MRAIITAASLGSVAATARELGYSESTISYHVREIERICRTELFEPEERGLRLTRRGRSALAIAQRLLHCVEQLQSAAYEMGSSGKPSPGRPAHEPQRVRGTSQES